ncbi:hypothetical protein PUN28_017963 [Cardiocondyla obscurior]|uniref:Uncharacterized protein n=1 Tax=Cardiocondyla obscurior TaxID=286306 RepID=A0AAW2EJ42_9HYME
MRVSPASKFYIIQPTKLRIQEALALEHLPRKRSILPNIKTPECLHENFGSYSDRGYPAKEIVQPRDNRQDGPLCLRERLVENDVEAKDVLSEIGPNAIKRQAGLAVVSKTKHHSCQKERRRRQFVSEGQRRPRETESPPHLLSIEIRATQDTTCMASRL